MEDLISKLTSLVADAQAALDTVQTTVPVRVVDPTWEAIKAVLVAHGWSEPNPPEQASTDEATPAEEQPVVG